MPELRLTLLGRFELSNAAGAVELRAAKDRALLAFLAVAPGRSQSRDRLAGLLWSEHDGHQARDSLKQALMRLRRALVSGDEPILQADRQSVALDRGAIEVDAAELQRLAGGGSLESLVQATALYRGPFL